MTSQLFTYSHHAFTQCRHILKTVKNVTVAKFELAFTRCWNNLKMIGNLTVKTLCKTLMPKKCTFTLRIDQLRSKSSKSIEKCSFSSLSSVHTMLFPKCTGYSSVFKIYRTQGSILSSFLFRSPSSCSVFVMILF